LLGADLKKDTKILHAAYNDSLGITAKFNLNLLKRINRELGADFDLNNFEHLAFYNESEGRIEMHLKSLKDQRVNLGKINIELKECETIHTENSYKYSVEQLHQLARESGFNPVKVWTDPAKLFSVHLLRVAER
jgi:uncharacterized SAM-dependent methyltransferase